MSYVFLSYSRKDFDFANKLTHDLEAYGVEVWRDIDQIAPGTNWQDSISGGIKQAAALVIVISNYSYNSIWIKYELEAFIKSGRRVLPIIINPLDYENIPLELKNIQWVDFREDYQAGLSKLLPALTPFVTSKAEATGISKGPKSKGYVFLNYCEDDSDFLEILRLFLERRGYGFWDYAKSDRDYHTQLFLELEMAIKEASAVLSILSPHWKRSKWTIREYLYAEEIGSPIFLLKAKEMEPTLVIAGIPYIDFVGNTESGLLKLDKELNSKGL